MWIKICANTSLDDAIEAARLGADAVGFVFAASKRQVTAAQVREITARLPGDLEKVGVFPVLPAADIAAIAETAGLTGIQLHGGWDAALTGELTGLVPHLNLIQTAHWQIGDEAAERIVMGSLAAMPAKGAVLVDAKVGDVSGGTGKAFDWSRAAQVFAAPAERQMILAGGLRPENVAEAIHTLHPWGVDVASGVEAETGRKDFGKLRSFIANARNA